MSMTTADLVFLNKRRKLLAAWPWVGGGLISVLVGFAAWLWFTTPLMINPWAAMRSIEAGTVEENTLAVMAVMLPIVVMACLGLLLSLCVMFYAAFSNERRLIEILDRQTPMGENREA